MDTDTLGSYTCNASWTDVSCYSTPSPYISVPVNVAMLERKALKDPKDASVTAGSSHVFTCVFPDPYGDTKDPKIEWFINGVYKTGVNVLDTHHKLENITTTLSIDKVHIYIFTY